jgi:tRNA pseudouridine55 synthase
MEGCDIEWDAPVLKFKVKVSSGTYIRSLLHDLGQNLSCGAIMTGLRRTRVGEFKIEDAKTIEQIQESTL